MSRRRTPSFLSCLGVDEVSGRKWKYLRVIAAATMQHSSEATEFVAANTSLISLHLFWLTHSGIRNYVLVSSL